MIGGYSVTVARFVSNREEWFDSTLPLQLVFNLPTKIAMNFRKQNLKGFLHPGRCNYYIGATIDGQLFGILGFAINVYIGRDKELCYDLLLKADTVNKKYKHSMDLLLYLLRTKPIKANLGDRFCRDIDKILIVTFTPYPDNNRYRKHAQLLKRVKMGNGYKLYYVITLGVIPTVKEARALFMDCCKRKQDEKPTEIKN